MPQLNANIPYQEAFVRNAFLYSDFTNQELTPCYIFGVKALLNSPLLFHCQLSNGAIFYSLPIHAFVHKEQHKMLYACENTLLSLLQYWNMQSSDIAVVTYKYLENYTVDCFGRDKVWRRGQYLFTIDDYYADANNLNVGYAEDTDAKCFHIIKLDCGYFCAYPNNYLRFHNLNFVDAFDKENPPKYKPNKIKWNCEYDSTVKPTD